MADRTPRRQTILRTPWRQWIGRNAAPNFDGIDPLISGELYIWLLNNRLSFYYGLPEYPASAAVLVQHH